MSTAMRELRSAVMILVEASWEDESGAVKNNSRAYGGQVCQRGMYTGQNADRSGREAENSVAV